MIHTEPKIAMNAGIFPAACFSRAVLSFNKPWFVLSCFPVQALEQCSDEDLMEVVFPRLTKVMTAWEFILMKVILKYASQWHCLSWAYSLFPTLSNLLLCNSKSVIEDGSIFSEQRQDLSEWVYWKILGKTFVLLAGQLFN